MTAWQLFLNSWDFHPTVVIGCALFLVTYLVAVRFQPNRKTILFSLGVLVIFLALVSPVDDLGDIYLFSAHMVQHMMLGMIAPLLLVTGLPSSMAETFLKLPLISRLENILGYPPLALVIANGTFWIWHLPVLYDLTLANETVHIFEHLMFIVTGVMLWWPVFKPIPQGRLTPLAAIVYMAIAASLSTILGVIFTISDTPYYAGYAYPPDPLGALKLIRDDWGLNQIADQKLGGAIMWEPAGAIFLWAIMSAMIDWFKEEYKAESEAETKADSKAESKADSKAESKADSKSDCKLVAKDESKNNFAQMNEGKVENVGTK
jgi:cytochrome c oxidase assembly factor CtaG